MPSQATPKWSTVKPKLVALSGTELIQLVQALFELSTDNKLLITTKIAPEEIPLGTIESYREKIVRQFFPKRGIGKLNLRDAKKAISDYRKATSDLGGSLDLMLTYVEQGTEFTNQFGDISEAFYLSLETMLEEISKTLRSGAGRSYYRLFLPRLQSLREDASPIGWGYPDTVNEILDELEADFNREK